MPPFFNDLLKKINLAIKFSDQIHFRENGTLIKSGKTLEVLNETLMQDVFDITSSIMHIPDSNMPVVFFGK